MARFESGPFSVSTNDRAAVRYLLQHIVADQVELWCTRFEDRITGDEGRLLIMKNKTVGLWLSALAIPAAILIGVQIDTTSGPSIGGGGYDLGPFLYSWLLVIVTVGWSLCACAAALLYRDRASSRQALGLTAMGIITVALVLIFCGGNLS